MRRVNVMCLAAVLLTAGFAGASTTWDPEANEDPGAIVDGAANWNVADNWSNEVPGVDAQTALFTTVDAPEAQVTTDTPVFTRLELNANNVIRVMDGGTVTGEGEWWGIGRNSDGHVIVEEGGVFQNDNHMWIGRGNALGTLEINGGTVRNGLALGLGTHTAEAIGLVYLNDGLLAVEHLQTTATSHWYLYDTSLMDIRFGTFTVNRDLEDQGFLPALIDDGKIIAFGGLGTVNVEIAGGVTTITAISPLDPSPAYRELVPVPEGETAPVDLEWTNMDPNDIGDSVWVDVWFGTDPTWVVDEDDPNLSGYADFEPVLVAGEDATTVQVNAPVIDGIRPSTYYWRVDSYIYGDPAAVDYDDDPETPVIVGDVFRFDVNDDLPPTVVIDTPDTATWIDEPVQLQATVTKSGPSEVFYEWTSSDPNTTFFPNNEAKDPVVDVDYAAGEVELTITVWDEASPETTDSDSMVLYVASDPCDAAVAAGVADAFPMDLTGSCTIGLEDFVILLADWLADYALTEPTVIPTD